MSERTTSALKLENDTVLMYAYYILKPGPRLGNFQPNQIQILLGFRHDDPKRYHLEALRQVNLRLVMICEPLKDVTRE